MKCALLVLTSGTKSEHIREESLFISAQNVLLSLPCVSVL